MTRKDDIPEDDYGIEQWATNTHIPRQRGDFAEIMQVCLSDAESQLLLYKQAYKGLLKSRAYWRRHAFYSACIALGFVVADIMRIFYYA